MKGPAKAPYLLGGRLIEVGWILIIWHKLDLPWSWWWLVFCAGLGVNCLQIFWVAWKYQDDVAR